MSSGRERCGSEGGKKAGPRALSRVLTLLGLSSSSHRFTQNLSVFRRDVAEALRSDGSADLDMMS